MKIAVLSGKGGTGKTTVSASLASVIKPSQYIDCDVEEPNGYIFMNPNFTTSETVKVEIPSVEQSLCTGCGDCAKVCQFNALAVVKGNVLVFPELCHHCDACYIVCKTDALKPIERSIGVVESNSDHTVLQGKLNIGELITIPVIKKLKSYIREDIPVIIDCSPGASCTVVESLSNIDYCLLVTEPTPFGLHDLKIAVSLVQKLGIPFGIVINKVMDQNNMIRNYCKDDGLDILLEIPYSREFARSYSNGILPVMVNSQLRKAFEDLFQTIKEKISR